MSPNTTYIIAIGHVDGVTDPLDPPDTDMSFGFCIQPLAYDTSSSGSKKPTDTRGEDWGVILLPEKERMEIWSETPRELELIDVQGRGLYLWKLDAGERRVENLILPDGVYWLRERNGVKHRTLLWQQGR